MIKNWKAFSLELLAFVLVILSANVTYNVVRFAFPVMTEEIGKATTILVIILLCVFEAVGAAFIYSYITTKNKTPQTKED